jgi:anaerobic magnesium-protoporphyrin IX monomethyl ester cyclase
LRKVAPGEYVRLRSHESIMKEVSYVTDRYPLTKEMFFEVETFGVDVRWAVDLCSRLREFNARRKTPLSFGTNLRINPNGHLEELFAALKSCNFKYVNIGLESGSERIRHEVLNRRESNQDIINAVGLAKRYGLRVHFFNMIGIPGETLDDFNQTVNMNRLCLPEEHSTSIFYPYPGTKLYSICREMGLMRKPPNPDLERQRARLGFPGFSKRQIERKYVWFDYYVYKGHKPIVQIMASVLGCKMSQSPLLKGLYNYTNHGYIKWSKNLLKTLLQRLA